MAASSRSIIWKRRECELAQPRSLQGGSAMKSMALRLHFGLRGRLFTAFGAVAALTVLASAVAMISYGNLGDSLGAITTKRLPEITRASEVVKATDEVAAAAPRFLAAA